MFCCIYYVALSSPSQEELVGHVKFCSRFSSLRVTSHFKMYFFPNMPINFLCWQNPLWNTTAGTKDTNSRTGVYKGWWPPLFKTQHTHIHSQTETLRYLWETTRTVNVYNYCMLSLFGLVLNLRHINLFPGEELPDASSVVLISQSVQEDVEGGRGLSQDRSHLQRQVQVVSA